MKLFWKVSMIKVMKGKKKKSENHHISIIGFYYIAMNIKC